MTARFLAAAALASALALPAGASGMESLRADADGLMGAAREAAKSFGLSSEDGIGRALAVLYQRVFDLEDKRREAELEKEALDQELDRAVVLYRLEYDRYATKEGLVRLSQDPGDRRYPPISNSGARKALEEIRRNALGQSRLVSKIEKLDASTEAAERRIDALLERLPAAG